MGQWLTPDNAPPTQFWVRRLFIPADPQYGAIVSGALADLCYPSSFEQVGAVTPDEVAEAFSVMYDKYVVNDQEPPFWGDEDDVDQDEPVDQPWYETLSDWIIEGFLAITGFPQAAIVYSTTVPRIRLAIRNGDWGALFKVLVDNLEMYSADSYSATTQIVGHTLDIEQFAIDNDLGDGPWEIRIIHDGPSPSLAPGNDGQLQVVRKRLEDEMPLQFRQTPDPCILEFSQDDGGTWETAADLSLCVPDVPTAPPGAMLPYGASAAPDGWLSCDGAAVSRSTYAALFAVIGTSFGTGDGSTTFNVPDLRGRAAIGTGQGSGLTNRVLATNGGAETHQLTTSEMPAHSHGVYSSPTYSGSIQAFQPILSPNTTTAPTSSAGSGSAHNNMQPWLAVSYIIKT